MQGSKDRLPAFPIDLQEQRERVSKFTQVVQRAGGIAVKVESGGGVAHTRETKLRGSLADLYCCDIVLVRDTRNNTMRQMPMLSYDDKP